MHIVRSLKFLVHFERSRFQCIIRYELSIRNYSERTSFHPKLDASPKLCTITICIITISTVLRLRTPLSWRMSLRAMGLVFRPLS